MSYESILASHNERLQYLIDNPEPVDSTPLIEGTITEIRSDVESIGDSAFNSCSQLTTVDFPAATSIGNFAFQSCSQLTTVDFPAATSIGDSAFDLCSQLTTVILRSPTICGLSNKNAFDRTPIASGTGYIYVPSALVDSYKSATNWSTYAAQFRAIEDYPDICGG